MSVVPECNNALVIVQNIIKNISQPTSIIIISGLFEFELVSIDLDDATYPKGTSYNNKYFVGVDKFTIMPYLI